MDSTKLVTGGNSGFQAINLSVLAGAKKVILIGYDAKEPAGGEKSHWFGEHPIKANPSAYALYRRSFKDGHEAIKAAGVRVINANLDSAITQFEKMEINEALRV